MTFRRLGHTYYGSYNRSKVFDDVVVKVTNGFGCFLIHVWCMEPRDGYVRRTRTKKYCGLQQEYKRNIFYLTSHKINKLVLREALIILSAIRCLPTHQRVIVIARFSELKISQPYCSFVWLYELDEVAEKLEQLYNLFANILLRI